MDFGETHRFLKRVNIGPLLEALRTVDPALWDAEEAMRKVMTGTRPTRAIYIWYTNALYMPHDRPIEQDDVSRRAGWDWFSPTVLPIVEELQALYAPGSVVISCQIALLPPGGHITRHQDTAPLLRASHRIHVPLITWPEVTFFIDDAPHVFEAGHAFELNNQRYHEVRHGGTEDRYHLIIDLLPKGYDPAPMAAVLTSDLARLVPRMN